LAQNCNPSRGLDARARRVQAGKHCDYRGFGFFVSLEFLLFAGIAYRLSVMSRRSARAALPLMVTLEIGCTVTALLSWMYFFAAPMVTSLAAVVCSTAALAALARDARLEADA
jgi:hypothetical protein